MTICKEHLTIGLAACFAMAAALFTVSGAFADGYGKSRGDNPYDAPASGHKGGEHNRCTITDAFVVDGTITINGANLMKRKGLPTVTIGGLPADVLEADANQVVVTDPGLEPGSYKLELAPSRRNGDDCDTFEVAVGAMGPSHPLMITIATDQVNLDEARATSIRINNAIISGDVAPGVDVQIRANWALAGGGTIYAGFDDHPRICILTYLDSPKFFATPIKAPTTSGHHRLSILWTEASVCTEGIMPANPLHGSTLGVVAVR